MMNYFENMNVPSYLVEPLVLGVMQHVNCVYN
jgi:hypothetical protein